MKIKINFKDVNIKILTVEVIIFFSVILTAGYFVNKHDPLGINSGISYFLIFLTVVTLYYGIAAGIISLILSLPALVYFYPHFPMHFFLFNLLMVLIMGEFYFYWSSNIKKAEEKSEYIEEKFNELRKNFYFLKLSLDQIEKSYVTKPVTIRGVVQDVKKLFALGGKPYKDLINMVSQLFKIERASLFILNNADGGYEDAADIGDPVELNLKDYLVEESFREKTLTYLPSILSRKKENSSEYLAVIPIFDSDNAVAVFAVKDMAFTEYNKESLLLIYLFLYYFFEYIKSVNGLSEDIRAYINVIDIDFLMEMERLYKIWDKFKIESALLIFYVKDADSNKEFYSFMEDKIRNLDMIASVNNGKTIIILLPFTPKSGCKSFINRVDNGIIEKFGKTFLGNIGREINIINDEPGSLISNINIIKHG